MHTDAEVQPVIVTLAQRSALHERSGTERRQARVSRSEEAWREYADDLVPNLLEEEAARAAECAFDLGSVHVLAYVVLGWRTPFRFLRRVAHIGKYH
jgi:hypothetical protein